MVGEATMPAISAASCGASIWAQRGWPDSPQPGWLKPKYVRAADSTPYAPLPK
jgi:hypothetical protein